MAFPCNQFRDQEPGPESQIKAFAREKYGAQFPLFSKIEVNGPNAHPVYQYLRRNSELYNEAEQVAGEIPWNFAKFLVNAEGKVVKYWGPQSDPESTLDEVRKLL